MKARQYAQVALLMLASFAVGLTWGRNWPAVIGLAIGSLMMTLVMAWMHAAKRASWKAWHRREIDRTRAESLDRGWKRCEDWHHRQRIGRTEDDATDAISWALHRRQGR